MMARVTPTMEMFMVGAYLQLVEGCDSVAYNAELLDRKEFWVDVVGRCEAKQRVYYVDFADKFDWYPPEMRPDTLVKKLVRRYVLIWRTGRALEYEADGVRCQLWLPRAPVRRVAEALPKVIERLRERHYIELEVISPDEVAARIPPLAERIRGQAFDYDNLFIRAVLLADGRVNYQMGAPMSEEHIARMYRFPLAIGSPDDLPAFLERLLTSRWMVHWLGFGSPSFDDLRFWLRDTEPDGVLAELLSLLERTGVPEEALDPENEEFMPRRYAAEELAELTAWVLAHAEALRGAVIAEEGEYRPLQVEIEFMVPYLSRGMDLVEPSVIEREILRYGGDRDEMMAHFAEQHPEKTPYRVILRLELYEPNGHRAVPYHGGHSMEVSLVDARVGDSLRVAVTLNYATHFTGYFILLMHRFAASI